MKQGQTEKQTISREEVFAARQRFIALKQTWRTEIRNGLQSPEREREVRDAAQNYITLAQARARQLGMRAPRMTVNGLIRGIPGTSR